VIRRDSRAQSLDIIVEMRFQSAGDICGALLVIYCISSLCTERFDCQNHAIPYTLIRRIPVATIEIGHCRTFIYIPMMNNVIIIILLNNIQNYLLSIHTLYKFFLGLDIKRNI